MACDVSPVAMFILQSSHSCSFFAISTPAFPIHVFFECPAGSADGSWLTLDHAWVWIIMFLSQVTLVHLIPSILNVSLSWAFPVIVLLVF